MIRPAFIVIPMLREMDVREVKKLLVSFFYSLTSGLTALSRDLAGRYIHRDYARTYVGI